MRKIHIASLPLYCDYSCPHAKFGEEDAIGACRKELAVYCTLLNQYHTKNLKCLVKS